VQCGGERYVALAVAWVGAWYVTAYRQGARSRRNAAYGEAAGGDSVAAPRNGAEGMSARHATRCVRVVTVFRVARQAARPYSVAASVRRRCPRADGEGRACLVLRKLSPPDVRENQRCRLMNRRIVAGGQERRPGRYGAPRQAFVAMLQVPG